MYQMGTLIGMKVVAIRAFGKPKRVYRGKYHEPQFIFFDDGETYMEFEEQDYYTYHDCSSSARHIHIWKNKQRYNNLINSPDLVDANTDL